MATTLFYNVLMLAVDGAVLRRLWVKRTVVQAGLLAIAAAAVAVAAALVLGSDRFDALRLTTWATFAHGIVMSLGAAVVFWRSQRVWSFVALTVATALGAIAADAFLIEPEWLEVSHVELTSAKLTRPYRIVILADYQPDRVGDYERMVIRRVAEANPDIVLLAGDYLQPAPGQYYAIRDQVNALLREANLAGHARVFAVKGDQEGEGQYWTQIFDGLGYTVVSQTESFDLGGGLFLTCLSEDASFSTLTQVTAVPDHYHLVVGHAPNFALGNVAADLLVAGHTHGGQVRLPFIGPMITLSQVPHSWAAGLTELPDGRRLLVTRGTGMERGNAPRLRFLCRPELVVLDLKPE